MEHKSGQRRKMRTGARGKRFEKLWRNEKERGIG